MNDCVAFFGSSSAPSLSRILSQKISLIRSRSLSNRRGPALVSPSLPLPRVRNTAVPAVALLMVNRVSEVEAPSPVTPYSCPPASKAIPEKLSPRAPTSVATPVTGSSVLRRRPLPRLVIEECVEDSGGRVYRKTKPTGYRSAAGKRHGRTAARRASRLVDLTDEIVVRCHGIQYGSRIGDPREQQ